MSEPSLQRATALVTGADSELGFAVARRLQRAGVRLALHVSRAADVDQLKPLDAACCFACAADDEQQVRDGLAAGAESFGALNILIPCHARAQVGGLLQQSVDQYWTYVHEALTGTFLFVREAASG